MTRRNAERDRIVENLNAIWPAHNRAFARLLTVLRAHFDGDLDAMLVLLTISIGTERDDWRDVLLEEWRPKGRTRPTNASSIAQATGVPRESVRRKLLAMQAKGWVTRGGDGNWGPTGAAADDLRPATLATIDYLQAVFDVGLATTDRRS